MKTMRAAGSRPIEMSTTKMRSGRPTCGAASPTPGAAYMVSIMSSTSRSISGVTSLDGLGRFVENLIAVFEDGSQHPNHDDQRRGR